MSDYRVDGMTCGGCVASVEKAIKAIAPGADIEVSLDDKRVRVTGFEDVAAIARAIEDAGFDFGGEL